MAAWRLALALCIAPWVGAGAGEPELDPLSGLVRDGDWELVRTHCSACHSTRLITQQRGDKAKWVALIRWMQATQNLWPLESEVERRIVAYLAEHYPPGADRRRAPLPADAMPDNPYPTEGRPQPSPSPQSPMR
ncbi:MAG: hypothetical protein AAGD86_11980 [Pseudomonadota bacterium]